MLPLTEAEQQLVVFPLEMVTGCMEAVGGHAEVWPGERLGWGVGPNLGLSPPPPRAGAPPGHGFPDVRT